MNGESPIEAVRGTRDWLPFDSARLSRLEMLLIDRFGRAGYQRLHTSILEPIELHERKSGAGIVAKLFEVAGAGSRVCLRPELTAGIVEAFTKAEIPPRLPWRVSHSGPVFRQEDSLRADRLREFHQVGVERIGEGGPAADAEVIWLAYWSLAEAGITDATIRIGHVGLILELLARSGLPPSATTALVEMFSAAASEGGNIASIESSLDQLSGWLQATESSEIPSEVDRADDPGIDRLFRTLVPVVTGRRTGPDVIHRLRKKWDLGHSLAPVLAKVRSQIHDLADLRGPVTTVLERLSRNCETLAPDTVIALRSVVAALANYGVDLDRVELDLGFGRGIGFYSQLIFELVVPTADGPIEVCGGGRYDGLAKVLGSDRDDRGVGFAFGLERLDSLLTLKDAHGYETGEHGFIVVAERPELIPVAARLVTSMRRDHQKTLFEPHLSYDDAVIASDPDDSLHIIEVRDQLDAADCLRVYNVWTGHESFCRPGQFTDIPVNDAGRSWNANGEPAR